MKVFFNKRTSSTTIVYSRLKNINCKINRFIAQSTFKQVKKVVQIETFPHKLVFLLLYIVNAEAVQAFTVPRVAHGAL